jgi:hypothetical protein
MLLIIKKQLQLLILKKVTQSTINTNQTCVHLFCLFHSKYLQWAVFFVGLDMWVALTAVRRSYCDLFHWNFYKTIKIIYIPWKENTLTRNISIYFSQFKVKIWTKGLYLLSHKKRTNLTRILFHYLMHMSIKICRCNEIVNSTKYICCIGRTLHQWCLFLSYH